MAAFIQADETWVDEGDGFARLIVRLSERSASTVSVDWGTANASANSGADYRRSSGTLVFAPNEIEKIIEIPIVQGNPRTPESLEFFNVNFTNPVNAALADSQVKVFIVEEDAISATPRISVNDIVVDEGAGTASVVVRLDAASTGTVRVDYGTVDGSARSGSDYTATQGSLTFAAGEVVKTVTVALANDDMAEGLEQFHFRLSNASGAEIGRQRASILVLDEDDAPGSTPTLAIKDAWVGEGDGFARFIVTLSAASASAVTVSYSTTRDTTGLNDHSAPSGTLTFAPGEVVKDIIVAVNDDVRTEPQIIENFFVNLSNATGAVLAPGTRATGVIVDNDAPAQAMPNVDLLPGASTSVSESAGWIDVPIYLAAPSAGMLRLDYSTRSGTATEGRDFQAASGSLTFLPGEMVQTARILLTDDQRFERNETFVINFKEGSGAASPAALPFSTRITIVDDEAPMVGTDGSDRISGTDFEDRIYGRGGNDTLRGLAGNDRLYGENGKDKLQGDAGNDLLVGGKGRDQLAGGSGSDTLEGGADADRLTGGAGEDVFLFRRAVDTKRGAGRDEITDCRRGDDTIDLTAIDANTERRGDQKFKFIGADHFSDKAGELRFKSGILSGDTDGDGRADFEIELAGLSRLGSGDLLL